MKYLSPMVIIGCIHLPVADAFEYAAPRFIQYILANLMPRLYKKSDGTYSTRTRRTMCMPNSHIPFGRPCFVDSVLSNTHTPEGGLHYQDHKYVGHKTKKEDMKRFDDVKVTFDAGQKVRGIVDTNSYLMSAV